MSTMLLEEREYPLLRRKNVVAQMEFPKKPTPSSAEIRKELAAFLKVGENLIAVKYVRQKFGANTAVVTAHIYKDEQSLKDFEEIRKKKKEGAQSGQESQAKK